MTQTTKETSIVKTNILGRILPMVEDENIFAINATHRKNAEKHAAEVQHPCFKISDRHTNDIEFNYTKKDGHFPRDVVYDTLESFNTDLVVNSITTMQQSESVNNLINSLNGGSGLKPDAYHLATWKSKTISDDAFNRYSDAQKIRDEHYPEMTTKNIRKVGILELVAFNTELNVKYGAKENIPIVVQKYRDNGTEETIEGVDGLHKLVAKGAFNVANFPWAGEARFTIVGTLRYCKTSKGERWCALDECD